MRDSSRPTAPPPREREKVSAQRWFFDAWSRVYDADWVQRRAYWPLHDAVLERLDERRGARILDLGCGTGQLAGRLTEAFPHAHVIGCDFSAGMLERAAQRCPSARFVQGDAQRLPFPNATFDAVVSTEAFHWFPDQAGALAECFRVIRPGGRLLLAVVNLPSASVSELVHLGSRLLGEPFYWPSRAQVRSWVEAAGFRIEAQRRVSRFGSDVLPPVLTNAVRPARRAQRAAPAAPRPRPAPHGRRTRAVRGVKRGQRTSRQRADRRAP
jgi:SAM-dependent methyltransferase